MNVIFLRMFVPFSSNNVCFCLAGEGRNGSTMGVLVFFDVLCGSEWL